MLRTRSLALIGLVCLVSPLHLTGAFEVEPYEFPPSNNTELISFTVNQCPDSLGDACRVNYSLPLQFDLKFRTRVPFERLKISAYWLGDYQGNTGADIEPARMVGWSVEYPCEVEPSLCPASEGDERTYYGELDFTNLAGTMSIPGKLIVDMWKENHVQLLGLAIPMIGLD